MRMPLEPSLYLVIIINLIVGTEFIFASNLLARTMMANNTPLVEWAKAVVYLIGSGVLTVSFLGLFGTYRGKRRVLVWLFAAVLLCEFAAVILFTATWKKYLFDTDIFCAQICTGCLTTEDLSHCSNAFTVFGYASLILVLVVIAFFLWVTFRVGVRTSCYPSHYGNDDFRGHGLLFRDGG
mmetsp:Transcript_36232/g.82587  ORF Transcript_36232/g.82587 Transcript_36232/m.82587 type:complete len:181 (-) Transcript_36232:199-741(-)